MVAMPPCRAERCPRHQAAAPAGTRLTPEGRLTPACPPPPPQWMFWLADRFSNVNKAKLVCAWSPQNELFAIAPAGLNQTYDAVWANCPLCTNDCSQACTNC